MQSFLVAAVVPEKKEIQSYAKQNGIDGDYSDLLQNDQVRHLYGSAWLWRYCTHLSPMLCPFQQKVESILYWLAASN